MGEIYTLRTKWVKMMPFNGWKNVNVQVNCLLARRTTSFANTKISGQKSSLTDGFNSDVGIYDFIFYASLSEW